MIPQIHTISAEDDIEAIISQFAANAGIEPSQIFIIRPEKDELSVEQIHELQKNIQVAFVKKVLVVLLGVDNSGNEVQNSLLKSLEEEASRIQFLFIVHNPERLIPTILSRSIYTRKKYSTNRVLAPEKYEKVFSFESNTDITKDEAISKIDMFIENLSVRETDILRFILTMRKLILDNNMNPSLALDNILIFLSKPSSMNVTHEKQ